MCVFVCSEARLAHNESRLGEKTSMIANSKIMVTSSYYTNISITNNRLEMITHKM